MLDSFCLVTLSSPGKFSMAAFVRLHAQKVTAEIYLVQLIVIFSTHRNVDPH